MTDLELSRALALAIGWNEKGMYTSMYGTLQIPVKYSLGDGRFLTGTREFDYRDPAVIFPIATKYNAFPINFSGVWESEVDGIFHAADTPQKAIALAVIGLVESEKPNAGGKPTPD